MAAGALVGTVDALGGAEAGAAEFIGAAALVAGVADFCAIAACCGWFCPKDGLPYVLKTI